MLSKNETKYIQSLCQKKQRHETGLFIAEGQKLVEEMLQAQYPIKKIYATAHWAEQHASVDYTVVTEAELEKISSLQTPNQVLAIAGQKPVIDPPVFNKGLVLALDGIQDPGNFGSIIRIADWFGIQQVIASQDSVELYNPKTIQATMGSFMRVSLSYHSLETVLSEARVPVYGALLDGKDIRSVGQVTEGILLIGSEGRGIGASLLPLVKFPITIPRIGDAESLNAAVATGIIVSHLVGS
jgi:TrmH family RNA methyltransferase